MTARNATPTTDGTRRVSAPPDRFVACVIRHRRPVAFAVVTATPVTAPVTPTDDHAPPPLDVFADFMIEGTHADRYAQTPIEWSADMPERGDMTDEVWKSVRGRWSETVQRWAKWTHDGRSHAWTRLGSDDTIVGPTLRFGVVDGPEVDGTRLVRVSKADVSASDTNPHACAARMFAAIMEHSRPPTADPIDKTRPMADDPQRATAHHRDETT